MDMKADVDPQETREWLDSLHAVLQHEGEARASYLLDQLTDEAHRAGLSTSATLTTPYVNTISPERGEQPKWDRGIEHRLVGDFAGGLAIRRASGDALMRPPSCVDVSSAGSAARWRVRRRAGTDPERLHVHCDGRRVRLDGGLGADNRLRGLAARAH